MVWSPVASTSTLPPVGVLIKVTDPVTVTVSLSVIGGAEGGVKNTAIISVMLLAAALTSAITISVAVADVSLAVAMPPVVVVTSDMVPLLVANVTTVPSVTGAPYRSSIVAVKAEVDVPFANMLEGTAVSVTLEAGSVVNETVVEFSL